MKNKCLKGLDFISTFVSKNGFYKMNFKTLINKGFHASRRAVFDKKSDK